MISCVTVNDNFYSYGGGHPHAFYVHCTVCARLTVQACAIIIVRSAEALIESTQTIHEGEWYVVLMWT